MTRITAIYTPEDYPGSPDAATRQEVVGFFERLFPGYSEAAEKPDLRGPKTGWAIVAQNPKLAGHIANLSDYVVKEMPWTQRKDLRELAVQTLNLHFKCASSFESHMPVAISVGISAEMQAAIPYWRTSSLFDDEQRLIIEYASAVVTADVPADLFARVVARYGEKGALECTAAIANWSFWAMILNAINP